MDTIIMVGACGLTLLMALILCFLVRYCCSGTQSIPKHNPNAEIVSIDHTDWQKLRKLGGGSYGTVHLAINKRNGGLFAVKECRVTANREMLTQLKFEILTLSKLKHENIVKYYGAMNTDSKFLMYLEYVDGGTLQSRIWELGCLEPHLVKVYAEQILKGLAFIHRNQVVHRDLKPSNVLISVSGQVKLADFGTAFDLSGLTHTVEQTLVGTPAFIAPEVVRMDPHTTRTDIWSFGVVVYNMVTGTIPFTAKDKYALLLTIGRGEFTIDYRSGFPDTFRRCVQMCLNFDPSQRPSAEMLLDTMSRDNLISGDDRSEKSLAVPASVEIVMEMVPIGNGNTDQVLRLMLDPRIFHQLMT